METSHMFSTIETHTAGEPTRIITDGLEFSTGNKTTADYRRQFEEEYDWIRRLLIKEPRGHDDMFGAVPVPTSRPEADLGLFFLTNEGYLDMCGHATIGAVTAFLELGRLPNQESITVETPVGLIETRPSVTENTVEKVEFHNVESFVYGSCTPSIDGVDLDVDVVYAGNYLAMVDVEDLDLSISKENTGKLIELGRRIRQQVNSCLDIEHPFTGEQATVDLTEFYEHGEEVDRNITVFADGSIDRSPCGTGTSAKMTLLHSRGELGVGEPYRHQSVIGTEFEGALSSVQNKGGRDVVTPLVSGSAYIIAKNQFLLDPDDPIIGFTVEEP